MNRRAETRRVTRCAGLWVRREAWVLSWRGRGLLALLLVAAAAGWGMGVYPFLAVTERVPASVLVIEGWTGSAAMRQAAEEFRTGGYRTALLVRPVLGQYDRDGRFLGERIAEALVEYGVPQHQLVTIYPDTVQKDRTYHIATATLQWIASQPAPVSGVNVATLGPHARRSRLLFRKAFGTDCPVGIVSLRNLAYDPAHWWRTSEGVREVLGEFIAYSYARLMFREPQPEPQQPLT